MNIHQYIDDYINWLKNEITFSKVGEYYEINSPFLDEKNDYMQFYVKQSGDDIYFTDDGYTINELEAVGVPITDNRKKQLSMILNQYGTKLTGKEITLTAPVKEFPQRKHLYIQCLLKVNDLYLTSRVKTNSYFLDDIQDFFSKNEIYCFPNFQLIGKSGFSHNYDFAIQKSKNMPERLCLAINTPNKTAFTNTMFAWEDTRPVRHANTKLIVFLNDSNKITKGIEEGFSNYEITTIKWSERKQAKNLEILTA